MELRAGQEVDAYCTKCKMDLTHRIVAVVGGRPVKVECRTCYTVHVYRAPKSADRSAHGRRSRHIERAEGPARVTQVERRRPRGRGAAFDRARALLPG